jgi:hypothetical protein
LKFAFVLFPTGGNEQGGVDAPAPPFFSRHSLRDRAILRRIRGPSPAIRKQSWRTSVKRLFRIGLLTAIVLTPILSATLFVRSASASPSPAASASRKDKNKNKNQHKKEMKRNQKKLILKGRHERHKPKHT